MSRSRFNKYWLSALIGTIAVSAYPLFMGFSVIRDMAVSQTVLEENFPKYIIPYTPIAIAVIAAVLIMPLLFKTAQKFCALIASVLSLCVFFAAELIFESKIIVTSTVKTTLESWQMFMCYVPPEKYETRTWRAVDILIGDYDPAFKLHFYMISVILILSAINCLYGFARVIRSGDKTRRRALVIQSVCTVTFLGLCILACFTAFFRNGEITVSALSASLMSLFFVVLGITAGTYTGSFVLGRRKSLSVLVPSLAASLVTLAMYIGETILLNGHLYKLGSGILFDGIPGIILAPFDIFIIALSGGLNALICFILNKKSTQTDA